MQTVKQDSQAACKTVTRKRADERDRRMSQRCDCIASIHAVKTRSSKDRYSKNLDLLLEAAFPA